MTPPLPPRTPWSHGFPEVIVHGEEQARDAHPAYIAAKSGDAASALRLALNFLDPAKVDEIRKICEATDAWLLPVSADEAMGFNAIPDGMAALLSKKMSVPIVAKGTIVQSNKVSHTRAPGFQRIVTPAAFDGEAKSGRAYFLVDDHAGFGGTLANLCGHISSFGGKVVGTTTLTASPNSEKLAVSKLTLEMIHCQLGDEANDFWIETFGHGLDCLTQREAVVVCRQHSLIALKTIVAQAAAEVRARRA